MWKSMFLIAVFVLGGLLSHSAVAAEVYDTITVDQLESALMGGFDLKRQWSSSGGDLLLIQGEEEATSRVDLGAGRLNCRVRDEQDRTNRTVFWDSVLCPVRPKCFG